MNSPGKPETKERRSLLEGMKPIDATLEKDFVYGGKAKEAPTSLPTAGEIGAREPKTPATSRSPLTTRVRSDFALALKRASLERQLAGTQPNTLQDILEQALEPWLRANGYLG